MFELLKPLFSSGKNELILFGGVCIICIFLITYKDIVKQFFSIIFSVFKGKKEIKTILNKIATLDTLTAKVNKMEVNLSLLSNKLLVIDGNIVKMSNKFNELIDLFKTTHARLDNIDVEVLNIHEKINKVKDEIIIQCVNSDANLNKNCHLHQELLIKIDLGFNTLVNDLHDIEHNISELTIRLVTLENRHVIHDRDLLAITTQLNDFLAKLVKISEDIKHLSDGRVQF